MNLNKIFLIYNANTIRNYDLTFNEIANPIDKERKIMNIIIEEMKRSTIIEDENSIIKSKEIICPECHENCRICFKDYSINLYDCKNGHETNNIPFEQFNDTQKIDESKIKCNVCLNNTNNKFSNKQFYFCLTCKKNICPFCKVKHNKFHIIIDYVKRFYICEKHNFPYNSYLDDSKINLCKKCENEYSFKKIIYYKNILPNLRNLGTNIGYAQRRIEEFVSKFEEFKKIINQIYKNIKLFYDIIFQIYKNYDSEKMNYRNLENINEINNNMTIINDLNKILNNIFNNKYYENILKIYNKILNNKITKKNVKTTIQNNLTDQEIRERYLSKELENKEKHQFHLFIFNGDLEGFKECLEGKYGKKYNIFEEISEEGYYWTPLHYAMQYGKWNIIKFIIEYLKSNYLIEVGFRLKSKDNRCPLLCLLKSQNIKKKEDKKDIFEKIIINFTIPVSDEVKRELKKIGFEDLLGMIKPYLSQ
jgi:hypothetical protein